MIRTTVTLWRIGKRNYAKIHDVIITTDSIDKLEENQIKQLIEVEMGFEVIKNMNNPYPNTNNSYTDKNGLIEFNVHEMKM